MIRSWTHLRITHAASGWQWACDGPRRTVDVILCDVASDVAFWLVFLFVTPFDKPPINRFLANRPQRCSAILLRRMLRAACDHDGPLRPTGGLGEQYSFGGFSRSHIFGVSVQGQHGPHYLSTDTYISGHIPNSHAPCSQSNDFPSFLYTKWGWHNRHIKFTNARIQQVIEKLSCYSITTQLRFEGCDQLPPRPQQMCFTWLLPTSCVCFVPAFTEIIPKSITGQRLKQVVSVEIWWKAICTSQIFVMSPMNLVSHLAAAACASGTYGNCGIGKHSYVVIPKNPMWHDYKVGHISHFSFLSLTKCFFSITSCC